ncbi:TPA: ImmA/IrrE family metallo-endopeptidase [Streptococcus agalactiae]|nr:ImmA/IrrE family metallo-endopeptidase [Streptococcus agalactiae]HEN4303129.1 ImmA/IrrE family metallo-endopeptidase [Streptococcus agalactiae]
MTPYNYAIQTAKELVYKHMKLNDIKSKYYTYHSFFDYYSKELNIITIGSKLHKSISGFSIIDDNNFPSIFYQKDHSIPRQNFTKCHELGHLLLGHEGHVFTEDNINPITEYEANYFASFVLAPDIVLLYKITYENQSFKTILNDLDISKDCLLIRLSYLLKDYTNLNSQEIELIVTDFQRNKNKDISLSLSQVKDNIILDYHKIIPTNLDKAYYRLNKNHFITSLEINALIDNNFQKQLLKKNKNLHFDSHFDYGQNVFYSWDNNFLNSKQALKNVKNVQFDNHFFQKNKLGN